jgi:hypothetical protein
VKNLAFRSTTLRQASPDYRRFGEPPWAGSSGSGQRKGYLRGQSHFRVGNYQVYRLFYEDPETSARSTDFTKHVEAVSPPSFQKALVIIRAPAV